MAYHCEPVPDTLLLQIIAISRFEQIKNFFLSKIDPCVIVFFSEPPMRPWDRRMSSQCAPRRAAFPGAQAQSLPDSGSYGSGNRRNARPPKNAPPLHLRRKPLKRREWRTDPISPGVPFASAGVPLTSPGARLPSPGERPPSRLGGPRRNLSRLGSPSLEGFGSCPDP